MSLERLESNVSTDDLWASAAWASLCWQYSDREQVEYYGQRIANAVAGERISIGDLRARVAGLNQLDRQANEVVSADDTAILETSDLLELVALRLCHGAALYGLGQVRSRSRLQSYKLDYRRRVRLLQDQRGHGMGQLESRDLGLEILVLGDYAGKLDERNGGAS